MSRENFVEINELDKHTKKNHKNGKLVISKITSSKLLNVSKYEYVRWGEMYPSNKVCMKELYIDYSWKPLFEHEMNKK